jgi:hypothetical protein
VCHPIPRKTRPKVAAPEREVHNLSRATKRVARNAQAGNPPEGQFPSPL